MYKQKFFSRTKNIAQKYNCEMIFVWSTYNYEYSTFTASVAL